MYKINEKTKFDEFGVPIDGRNERITAAKTKKQKLAIAKEFMSDDEAEMYVGRVTDNPDGDIPGRQEIIALGKPHGWGEYYK